MRDGPALGEVLYVENFGPQYREGQEDQLSALGLVSYRVSRSKNDRSRIATLAKSDGFINADR